MLRRILSSDGIELIADYILKFLDNTTEAWREGIGLNCAT